ncbi:hypothetical protein m07a_06840 [Bartonella schoenbuchensis m07a]|uniref:Uncharacterized protein n=1 Tax=Bartonella schoenbuchensis m07a TaxID=1094496 RepID=N6UH12_9HYPH|nr:hypothetical protein m07a_06840 [Bartonella schoenbuchensis m07a]
MYEVNLTKQISTLTIMKYIIPNTHQVWFESSKFHYKFGPSFKFYAYYSSSNHFRVLIVLYNFLKNLTPEFKAQLTKALTYSPLIASLSNNEITNTPNNLD